MAPVESYRAQASRTGNQFTAVSQNLCTGGISLASKTAPAVSSLHPPALSNMSDGGKKLFVGNLAWSTDSETLRCSFELTDTFGAPLYFPTSTYVSTVMQDRETGRSRGFGFITFRDQANADAAIEALNGREVDGREIRVSQLRQFSDRWWRRPTTRYLVVVAIVEVSVPVGCCLEAVVVVDTVPATAAEATVVTKVVTAAATEETTVASHTEEVKVEVTAAGVAAKVTGEASKTATMLQAVAAVVGELPSPLSNVHESKFVLG
ncbi:uncharacterized protein VP01_1993g4 [Puccinia sorghi]|uniref:RRM domain-containing protein n=1 Tax=Puccinia sorghi TaxID=27349 RepID=A0A0L6VBP7_9BASI|nr:uncharacterized protein VP01_1993g4 [Puccinia sorghi]